MSAGSLLPSESSALTDTQSGAAVRQITRHPSIHHHPFYYIPCMDDAMRRLIFVSHRTGRPEIFAELRESGKLLQLTDVAGLGEWSVHPSHDGRYVYYVAGSRACRVDTETCREETLLDFGTNEVREPGMVGAAMGTTTLSHDDCYWAVPVKTGAMSRFLVIDTRTGAHDVILERDTIGHPEFHPSDNTLLRYAGPYHSRIWVIHRDGTMNRQAYRRKGTEWIVHEMWTTGSGAGVRGSEVGGREIITANWPHGCIGVDIDTGAVRKVCSFNAWHPVINRQGTLMCADTTFPDIGLQLFDPRDGEGRPQTLCLTGSSNEGKHWNTDHCPYDDEDYKQGKWKPYAPQHTHPHPCFSPDGRSIVFTSDRTGHAQVYEVTL